MTTEEQVQDGDTVTVAIDPALLGGTSSGGGSGNAVGTIAAAIGLLVWCDDIETFVAQDLPVRAGKSPDKPLLVYVCEGFDQDGNPGAVNNPLAGWYHATWDGVTGTGAPLEFVAMADVGDWFETRMFLNYSSHPDPLWTPPEVFAGYEISGYVSPESLNDRPVCTSKMEYSQVNDEDAVVLPGPTASDIGFDPTGTSLASEDVQAAIEELDA